MRTTLLLLAASLAPLYAQESPAPAAPAAQVAVATPAAQRAEVFSALACMPADISEFLVFTNVGGNILRLAESGKVPTLATDDLADELLAIDNFAIASSATTPATYALLKAVMGSFRTEEAAQALSINWAAHAREELREVIMETFCTEAARAARAAGNPEGVSINIPTTFIVLTCKPGQEIMLEQFTDMLLMAMLNSPSTGISGVYDENGFTGLRLGLSELISEMEEQGLEPEDESEAAILSELKKHNLCFVLRPQGRALIFAICESPESIQLPATPAESILATPAMEEFDAQMGKGMLMAAHFSKEFTELCQSINYDYILNLAAGASGVFRALGEADAAAKPAFDKAGEAAPLLVKAVQAFLAPIPRCASTYQAWYDENLHILASSDAMGYSYLPGQLRLTGLADDSKTMIYAETTPTSRSGNLPTLGQLAEAALNLAEGVTLTLDADTAPQATQAISLVKTFMPEIQALEAAGATIASGLDGHYALMVDGEEAPLPPIAGLAPDAKATMPRLAIYAGVADRAKLGSGWNAITATAGSAMGKLGADPALLSLLPIAVTGDAACLSYELALPILSPDTTPTLAVSDTGLAFGTSANFSRKVVESATGNTAFAGCVFSIRFAPIANSLQSVGDRLQYAPGEDSQELACKLKEAAEAIGTFSNTVKSVFGVSATSEGKSIIQVDVELK